MILATLLLPVLARQGTTKRVGCINNLKQTGLAFRTWALDNNEHFPMRVSVAEGGTMELVGNGTVFPHFGVMSNELSTPRILFCPMDTKRTCATNFTSALNDNKISYFVGLGCVEGSPSSVLDGDRNLTNAHTPSSRLVSLTTSTVLGWTKELHSQKGHLGFGDSSVECFTNGLLGPSSRAWGAGTNRLAMP